MELLTPRKSTTLLEAGLETLYHQCNEWMDLIAFEKDEMAFLADLLRKRKPASTQITKVEDDLAKLSDGRTDKVKSAVDRVRHMLDLTIRRNLSNERACREAFKDATEQMDRYKEEVRELKRRVLLLAHAQGKGIGTVNGTIRTIHARRAVRKYKNKPVDPSLIEKIIEAGCMAPSAMNRQPWKFHVVTDAGMISDLSKGIMKVAASYFPLAHGMKPSAKEDRIFHKAPVVIFLTAPKKDEWANIDIGACAENMMLAACSLGLGSCAIGFAKLVSKTRSYPTLKIPASDEVKLAVVLGYGDESPAMHERATNNVFHPA